jgi:NADPH-dependent glutamate synthase beta subunit-like oxidoreductase/ferredoxin
MIDSLDQPMLSVPVGDGVHPKDFDWIRKSIPCQAACPAHTNIPAYLDAIAHDDYDAAYRINLIDNVFPAVLGRVCTRPCEPACRHGTEGLGDPVAICLSKRAAADLLTHAVPVQLPPIFEPSGRKVAIVGSGAAGLAAARELALFGHDVTVYERDLSPGGLMVQGIPSFRLPRTVLAREIEQIRLTGVHILCGREVGGELPLEALLQQYDAVLLATGTQKPNLPNLPGVHLDGIHHGLAYLRSANLGAPKAPGQNVVVVGGGFTACDCARTAKRAGAKTVRIVYRRSGQEMYITPGEVEEMAHEGIVLETMTAPVSFSGAGNRVTSIRVARTRMLDPDESGRRSYEIIAGSEFDLSADTVLLATGQSPDDHWVSAPDRANSKLFTAGDFAQGSRSLIDAIASGKTAARTMDAFLMGRHRFRDVVRIEKSPRTGRSREMDSIPLHPAPTIHPKNRGLHEEVELGYDAPTAKSEAQRCYLCHFKYEIDNEYCIYCDRCLKVKPLETCIVKIERLIYDEDDRISGVKPWTGTGAYLLYVDPAVCIRCGACRQICPMACISLQKVTSGVVPTCIPAQPSTPHHGSRCPSGRSA